jgi:hypothetical protein
LTFPQLSSKRSVPATNESKKNKKIKITNNEEVYKSIVHKLDQLLDGQRSIEERIINLEKNSNTTFNTKDKSFVKVIKF